MTYVARDIKDRIAIGDDLFQLEDLGQGKVRLTPIPTEVIEAGSDINKALLQPMEDAIAQMMNTPIDLSNYYTKNQAQAKLIGSGSNQNIKTVNGENVMGTGNIEGFGTTLLWTNAVYNEDYSDFSSQTISLNLSTYSWVIMLLRIRGNKDHSKTKCFYILPVDNVSYILGSEEGIGRTFRVNASGIVNSVYSGSQYLIPIKIWGIKKG